MTPSISTQEQIAVSHLKHYPGRPTIVFLHDSLGCIRLWRDFPQKLGEQARCNVFIYDRHGYGQSGPLVNPERNNDYMELEADILAGLIETYHIGPAILFGHSDGASIALIAAAKYPGKVSAIITEGAHIFVEEETLEGIHAAINAYQATDLKTKLEKYHGDKTDAMFQAWAKTWTTDAYRSWNIERLMPLIHCPALIIQGEQDEYGTIKQVDGIVNQVSGTVEKRYLPNIKHTPHKEAPELILDMSAAFITALIANEKDQS